MGIVRDKDFDDTLEFIASATILAVVLVVTGLITALAIIIQT